MAAQTREQDRYLGGRPPYGCRLADAGPHPNKAHAAWGRRAHRLEPDPATAPVVRWMFVQRLAGHSVAKITRALNDAGILCPSAADPGRNPHRTGAAAYRCRHGHASATRPGPGRPKNTYVREDQILPHLAAIAILLGGDSQARGSGTVQVTAARQVRGPDRPATSFRRRPHLRPGHTDHPRRRQQPRCRHHRPPQLTRTTASSQKEAQQQPKHPPRPKAGPG
jgi:Recombinase